jgi:beta-lactamase class A
MKYSLFNNLLRRIFLYIISIFFITTLSAAYAQPHTIQQKLAQLETSSNGRIGLSAISTANNMHIEYRANERFPMGCTSKVIGVAAILKKSMSNNSLLQQKFTYTKNDLTNWSPITEKYVTDGMTIKDLCAAAICYSDNTAMNLLVKKLGGLQQINAFARSIDDLYFRQDHGWPEEALSGGPNNVTDSTTPAAMEKSLQQLTLGNVLAPQQRELLLTWLKNNTTGNARIRAGVPKDWIVGDKTGTDIYYGTTNDIAIIWPPHSAPIILTIYFTQNKKDAPHREDVIAAATRLVINEFE